MQLLPGQPEQRKPGLPPTPGIGLLPVLIPRSMLRLLPLPKSTRSLPPLLSSRAVRVIKDIYHLNRPPPPGIRQRRHPAAEPYSRPPAPLNTRTAPLHARTAPHHSTRTATHLSSLSSRDTTSRSSRSQAAPPPRSSSIHSSSSTSSSRQSAGVCDSRGQLAATDHTKKRSRSPEPTRPNGREERDTVTARQPQPTNHDADTLAETHRLVRQLDRRFRRMMQIVRDQEQDLDDINRVFKKQRKN